MLRSMTGFGNASAETDTRTFTAEVKTLNSKTLDVSVRIPRIYLDKEIEIRSLIGQHLDRGKISVYMDTEAKGGTKTQEQLDAEIVKQRFAKLEAVSRELGASLTPEELFKLSFQWPATSRNQEQPEQNTDLSNEEAAASEADWHAMRQTLMHALAACETFRLDEGRVLENKLLEYNTIIKAGLEKVAQLEPARAPRVRKRLEEKLVDFITDGRLEGGRLEQEMIIHLERLDISEEIVRLNNHIQYFAETIRTDPNCGKKINFISQEMGREINTIGSKANDAGIQKIVVEMKEELEKIKEQSANIL